MKTRTLVSVFTIAIALVFAATSARADTVAFKDGNELNGVIKKVANGKVVMDVDGAEKVFDILTVAEMDFTTPHLLPADSAIPVEHFLKDTEAQELVSSIKDIEKAADDIRFRLSQIQGYWGKKGSVTPTEESGWLAAKEEFRKPLSRYQESLNDLYFHVLARVDEYNGLMNQARKVYVGVKGPFNIGSSLVPADMEKLPLRKYVPATWWDTIYFNGYNMGYEDAVQNLKPKEPTSN